MQTTDRRCATVSRRSCVGPDGDETFVLVRPAERQKQEAAMHQRFRERIEAGLKSLGQRLAQA